MNVHLSFYLYTVCIFGCLGYALIAGGAPERLAILVIFTGSAISPFVMTDWKTSFAHAELGILCVDVIDQVLLTMIALRADRFWPIPVAAIHVLPIMAHLAKIVAPNIERHTYSTAQAFESYLILGCIAAGTWRHRQRLRTAGEDKSWSTFSGSPPPIEQNTSLTR